MRHRRKARIVSADFLPSRDVAQPGRALAWGARGRQFKSARPDQSISYEQFPLSQVGSDPSSGGIACYQNSSSSFVNDSTFTTFAQPRSGHLSQLISTSKYA